MRPSLQITPSIEQRQILSMAMQQAMQILQMPQLELAEWIRAEVESNPILEAEERPRETLLSRPLEMKLAAKPTLREHLLRQTHEILSDPTDLDIAVSLIDQLDERGFLSGSIEKRDFDADSIYRVLLVLQTLDPPGIFAQNLKESLWLQTKRLPHHTIAEKIVRQHFQDLLHGRFTVIQKALRISSADLQNSLHQLSRLRLRPASLYDESVNYCLVPDLILKEIDSGFLLIIGEEEIPILHIHEDYLHLTAQLQKKEEKMQMRSWMTRAKWLQRCIKRRRDILCAIGRLLVRKESGFFLKNEPVVPIDIHELAHILNVHESTAWRAVTNKMLACPHGMIPLKQFFSESATKAPIKDLLCRWIAEENKKKPLTDLMLMQKLQKQGFACARRTVAKYRQMMRILSAARRKVFN